MSVVSRWDDPEYPDLIPVMGTAEALRGPLWRWYPGLRAGGKLMPGATRPANITDHGRIGPSGVRLVHSGWSTGGTDLEGWALSAGSIRIYRFNFGVTYDRSLSFGYALDESTCSKKADYRRHPRRLRSARAGGYRSTRAARDRPLVRSARGWFPSGVDFATDREHRLRGRTGAVSAIDEVDGLVSRRSHCELDVVYIFRPGTRAALPNLGDRIAARELWASSVRKANRQMVICSIFEDPHAGRACQWCDA